MISSGALSSEEDLGKTSVEGGLDKEAVLVLPLKMTSLFLYFYPYIRGQTQRFE